MGKPNLRMNYAGMPSALCANLDLTPREFHLLRIPMFLAGMSPCWLEVSEKPEGTPFPRHVTKFFAKGCHNAYGEGKMDWVALKKHNEGGYTVFAATSEELEYSHAPSCFRERT